MSDDIKTAKAKKVVKASAKVKAAKTAKAPALKAKKAAAGKAKQPAPNTAPKASAKVKATSAPKAKMAPPKAPKPDSEPQTPPFAASADPMGFAEATAALTAEQRETIEKLSVNLARAAMTAQGAFAEAALRQADRPAALSPDPFHVGPALNEVFGKLASQPDRLMRAQADLYSRYMDLWQNSAKRMGGESPEPIVRPASNDKRFNDKDWSDNPVFDVMKQSYLLTSNWLNNLVSGVDDVDPMTKRRVEFFMKMMTDAIAPTNFLASNPAALREVIETGGESLVRGMENFAEDLERGGGKLAISQTDAEQFIVGENVATAPGKVIFQNDILQILQFNPTTELVHEIPLLIFPPWINKFYIMDLRVENSLIRWLTAQGFSVFVASWVNPDAKLAQKSFEDYMYEGIYEAADVVRKQCGVDRVNTVGYCIGGTLLACALAHMAAKGDTRINSATTFAAQQDFTEAGDLLLFTDEAWLKDIETQIDQGGGILSGQSMADTFNSLRSNDLIWSFFVNNYLLGKEPKPFDLLFWNSDQTRMPKTLHMFYLRKFYKENLLSKGELVMGGETLDMSKIKVPVYVQSSRDDHIVPYRSAYRGARLYGGPTTFTMAGSGHIAGVINAPVAKKYQHWTNSTLPGTVEEWIAEAVEHPGSWWPHWAAWLAEKSGKMVPARDPAKGPFAPLEDAPGSFVKVRS